MDSNGIFTCMNRYVHERKRMTSTIERLLSLFLSFRSTCCATHIYFQTMANGSVTKDIPDVGIDKYNLSTGYLASTGANTCMIFIVLFNDSQKIFMEHWSSFPGDTEQKR